MKWRPIDTAPKDKSPFWGSVEGDAIRMLWHKEFGEFVSSWREMVFADNSEPRLHSPVIHKPKFWMPLVEEPTAQE